MNNPRDITYHSCYYEKMVVICMEKIFVYRVYIFVCVGMKNIILLPWILELYMQWRNAARRFELCVGKLHPQNRCQTQGKKGLTSSPGSFR